MKQVITITSIIALSLTLTSCSMSDEERADVTKTVLCSQANVLVSQITNGGTIAREAAKIIKKETTDPYMQELADAIINGDGDAKTAEALTKALDKYCK